MSIKDQWSLNHPLKESDIDLVSHAARVADHARLLNRTANSAERFLRRWNEVEDKAVGIKSGGDNTPGDEMVINLNSPTVHEIVPQPQAPVLQSNQLVAWLLACIATLVMIGFLLRLTSISPTPSPNPPAVNTGWDVDIKVR